MDQLQEEWTFVQHDEEAAAEGSTHGGMSRMLTLGKGR